MRGDRIYHENSTGHQLSPKAEAPWAATSSAKLEGPDDSTLVSNMALSRRIMSLTALETTSSEMLHREDKTVHSLLPALSSKVTAIPFHHVGQVSVRLAPEVLARRNSPNLGPFALLGGIRLTSIKVSIIGAGLRLGLGIVEEIKVVESKTTLIKI